MNIVTPEPAPSLRCKLTNRARVRCRVSALALVLSFSFAAAAQPGSEPHVTKIEPPNWWAGYAPVVMVLLYGENLAGANISVRYPGASIAKVQTQPDGKHAFVWLSLNPKTRPGEVVINVKTPSGATRATLPVLARSSPEGKFQGITRDDVIYLIMPDRFADGDPATTSHREPPLARTTAAEPRLITAAI